MSTSEPLFAVTFDINQPNGQTIPVRVRQSAPGGLEALNAVTTALTNALPTGLSDVRGTFSAVAIGPTPEELVEEMAAAQQPPPPG